jgi:hypothetical protein
MIGSNGLSEHIWLFSFNTNFIGDENALDTIFLAEFARDTTRKRKELSLIFLSEIMHGIWVATSPEVRANRARTDITAIPAKAKGNCAK